MDNERDSPASDPRFLVATTLATLLLAASALICRTGSRSFWTASLSARAATSASSTPLRQDDDPEAKDAKASRPKERRRRGKDPLKDLLKNPKKSKLLHVAKSAETRLSNVDEAVRPRSSQTANENDDLETPSPNRAAAPSHPHPSSSSTSLSLSTSASPSESATSPNTSPTLSQSTIEKPSSPNPGSETEIHVRDDAVRPGAAPKRKNNSNNVLKSPAGVSKGAGAASWDPDRAGPSERASAGDSQAKTPQRHAVQAPNRDRDQKRELQRGSRERSAGRGRGASLGGDEPGVVVLPALEEGEEECVDVGEETNAGVSGPAASSSLVTTPNTIATPRRAPTPHNYNHSRRPQTPLSSMSVSSGSRSGTPPPQTQLASMRGALEAARMREERLGREVERLGREVDSLRWEGGRARRREAELQAQIHHLVGQLQVYGAMVHVSSHPLSPLLQHPHPHPHQHIQSPSINGTNGAPNGYTAFSPLSPSNPNLHSPPHPHLNIPSAQAQMILNTILPSPTMSFHPHGHGHSQGHSPHPSSFYAGAGVGVYPGSPQSQSQSQSPHGMDWMVFSSMGGGGKGEGAAEGSGSGSGSGEEGSVGSESVDFDGEGVRVRRRGRERERERWEWEDGVDGWVGAGEVDGEGLGVGVGVGVPGMGEEEEEGLNEVLADAILKRPGSIRGLSRLGKVRGGLGAVGADAVSAGKGAERESESPLEEFRFPSISDYGNVVRTQDGEMGVGVGEKDPMYPPPPAVSLPLPLSQPTTKTETAAHQSEETTDDQVQHQPGVFSFS
ncbi:hypothetical protein E4T56_gene4173 [Termitomyces sp. T112]|nr:hypothetical protein E4T56_gene4173 [Termitomyces sp. T112]